MCTLKLLLAPLSCNSLIFFLVLLLSSFVTHSLAADPDPLADFATPPPPAQPLQSFVFKDLFRNGDVSNGPGGVRATLDTTIFPAMESQSLTYTQFQMKPCGVNLPHTHPRATEMLMLIQGGPLQVGFVDTKGKAHIDILHEGDVTIFPRGLLHFELNVGSEKAFYISALNSQNPGTLISSGALLNLPTRAVASSLNVDLEAAKHLEKEMHLYSTELQMGDPSVCSPGKDITVEF